jgi:putative SOS response-associated peptidase YedK
VVFSIRIPEGLPRAIEVMCGRYRRTTREEELARIYRIPIPLQPDLPISYNIAPSQPVLTIRLNPETKQRSLDTLIWGLVPYFTKDGNTGFINARAERFDIAPAFRRPFQKRRCLIPADGFYEWKKTPEGKIPYSIEMKDGSPFVFAGLWDGWQNPLTNDWLRTCVIITGESNELYSRQNTYPDACHSAAGNPRAMAFRRVRKRNLETVSCQSNGRKTDLQTDQ